MPYGSIYTMKAIKSAEREVMQMTEPNNFMK